MKFIIEKEKNEIIPKKFAKERYSKKEGFEGIDLSKECWKHYRNYTNETLNQKKRELKREDLKNEYVMYKYHHWCDLAVEYVFLPLTVKNKKNENWLKERSRIWEERLRRERKQHETSNMKIFQRSGLPKASIYSDGTLKVWKLNEIVTLLKTSNDHPIKILWRPNPMDGPFEWNFPKIGKEVKNTDGKIVRMFWSPDDIAL